MEFLAILVLHFISLYLCPFFLKLVSHTHVHTGIVHPLLIQNLAPNLKNSLNYILCLVSPSQLPTAVLFLSCWQVSEFAALVRASAVGLLLLYLAPCRRDIRTPNALFLLRTGGMFLCFWFLLQRRSGGVSFLIFYG